ncbi:MAG: ubiquinone biosynthesis regulatory protein kinase UbiB [SAR86 cluster bacterium]|uniref:Ubiquinone biosynthesis regulatory protein kinase UbiB n=1 Tax=SAR86 cluster bacterium TaxID=2030880 RepID=A0A2A5B340_9GAMM|nr:MAG: ubiquinone biosynthesis regulatory protein kinase UbiB [SAR86 cluster bacterium]
MSHIPRLIKVLRIVAKYRLDEFIEHQKGYRRLRLLLLPYRIAGFLGKRKDGDRNQRLRQAMEELGPIYIKFGQLLSTRRDFLDVDLADELQSLQDNVPPFKTPAINDIIEASLGRSPDSIFSELEQEPFASASVAQVYKATLLNNDEVVVKVIRPGIDNVVAEDLKLLRWIALQIEHRTDIGKRLHPVEVVDDYERIIWDELDLQSEAANTSQLRRNFENSDVLYVPKVYWDVSSKNVMVMERIDGIPVADIDALSAQNTNFKKLAETGVDIFFTQVFEHNFFHADMHPGNIFVSRKNPDNPQYIAIDCAIIGSLTNDDQEYLAKNLLAIFKRDYRKVAELHVACGWVPKHTKIHEFESAMRSVCEPIFEKPLKDISFGQLLVQLFRTASRFEMEVQPSLVLLQKTLLNVEGLGRQLYPELDLWQTALPYLENWQAKRMNPFNLLSKIQENIPNWIDQLPQLPQLLIDAATESGQLSKINESLRQQQAANEKRLEKQRQLSRNMGILALIAAMVSLIPAVTDAMANVPIITVSLGFVAVYLLCFRR